MTTTTRPQSHNETSALLPSQKNTPPSSAKTSRGNASYSETVLNLAKTCMGTGTLALPFAARQGGVILNVLGLVGIAAWNICSVDRLCDCLNYINSMELDEVDEVAESRQDEVSTLSGTESPGNKRIEVVDQEANASNDVNHGPPPGTSTFGKVAFFAFDPKYGHAALTVLDVTMVLLLAGIIIAYEDAIIAFLSDTPLSAGSNWMNAFLTLLVIGPLSLVPDMGYLAKASAVGLSVLAGTMAVIAVYGDYSTGEEAFSLTPLNGLTGVSHWFGCVVFGFGVVPLTYNYHASMTEPDLLVEATGVALSGVALAYMAIGMGLLIGYPNIEGDVLTELPIIGVVPAVVRLCMVVVVLVTAPLLVVPCGELVEGKVFGNQEGQQTSFATRSLVRLSICSICTLVAVTVPGFVFVLSFVGCCSVALVGFVFPPLLHLTLTYRSKKLSFTTILLDGSLLLWGIVATVISTTYSFRNLINH